MAWPGWPSQDLHSDLLAHVQASLLGLSYWATSLLTATRLVWKAAETN